MNMDCPGYIECAALGKTSCPDCKPFTLRMAGYELLGKAATEKILEDSGAAWLAVVLMAFIEANKMQTPTARILRDWNDRRHAELQS